MDASGIYVVGETIGELVSPRIGGSDYFLRKFDASGNTVWTRQFGTDTTDGGGYGGAVATNNSGVYVTGVTSGTFPGQTKVGGLFDAFVQKFDLNGNPLWVRQFGTTDDDWGYGASLGGGLLYISGQTGSGLFLWRFDENGNDLGNIQRGGGTYGFGVATDSTGAYVAGEAGLFSELGQQSLGDSDAFVFKVPHPPALNGVSDAFNGQPGVSSTTWISLYGANMGGALRIWDDAIQGTQLPTTLDGVSVTVNGRPAPVYFTTATQVNILGPLDDTTGDVDVVVTNAYGSSRPLRVRKSTFLPAFCAPFGTSAGLMVTAVAPDGTLVGKPGVDPRVKRAARPGEILQFFATGFGPTNPAVQSDQLFSGAPVVVNPPTVTIGGKQAALAGSGNLVGPGLYQFNLTIPDLADGDHAIIASVGGTLSSATVFLSVAK
jgi:uncharacterized protein (TIGR03437 family)